MPNLGTSAIYYGGGQRPAPANVITTSGAPNNKVAGDLGDIAIDNATATAYMLASHASGVYTWVVIGSAVSGVASITGTAHQIAASAPIGAVTLSLTDGVSLGAYQATVPPAGGLIMPGKLGVGTNAVSAAAFAEIIGPGTTGYVLHTGGNINTTDGSANCIAIFDNTSIHPTGGANFCIGLDTNVNVSADVVDTINSAFSFYGSLNISANLGTITDAGMFYSDIGLGAGLATNGYGLYVNNPIMGAASNTAIYSDNLSIGYIATTPPTNGAIISGSVSVGSPTPDASAVLEATSITQGFLPPRMTTIQKNAIAAPAAGLVVFDTTLTSLSYYNGVAWTNLTSATSGTTTLVGGNGTAATSSVTALSKIFLTHANTAGTIGNLYVGAITPGVSFDIHSDNALDISNVNWFFFN